jgi:hypothetical protein
VIQTPFLSRRRTGAASASLRVAVVVGVMLTCAAGTAQAAKDVFIRSKPHVNVGTVDGVPTEIGLHANVHIDTDTGDASGPLQLSSRRARR